MALDEKVEGELAMAVREAVTNILRHAGAHRVDVELAADQDGLRLQIVDDGRGGANADGNGLSGMRERMLALGGSLDVDSAPGGGTRLTLRVPAPAARAGA